MTASKLLVIGLLLLFVGVVVGLRFYFNEEGRQDLLAEVQCDSLLPTAFEFQGERLDMSREQTCAVVKTIAMMKPTGEKHHNDSDDPWHYFGRIRILPKDDVWFVVFNARRSDDFRPEFSLLHHKGVGWTVIGQFDAALVLKLIGVDGRLDTAKLRSPASLTPTDQSTPM